MARKSYIQGILMSFILFDVGYVYSENIATGTNYTFRPAIQGKIENFDWRHNGYLVVEWDPDNGAHWYRYRERAHINSDTGDLTLQVKKEDSGVFRGQFQVKGVLQYFERTITVIDTVSEPKVTCEQNDTDITLPCSVDPPVQAEFTWTGPDEFSHVGKSVHITRKESDSIYYCTAKNEVSQKTIEFKLKECPGGYVYSQNIATGTTYTFRPTIQGKIENFDWRHNGYLVVEWDPDNGAHWYRYGERAHINSDTGDLTLQVKKEDSGVFKGQFQVKGVLRYFERTITVIDAVSEPKVTCEQNDTDITLLCSVDPPVPVEFTWRGPDEFSHVGKSVHITRKERDDSIYYCTAKNEVSQKTIEFKLKECPGGYVYSQNIATGTNYTFRPTIQGKIENFDWRHNGYLVVEWDPDNGAHWYRYGERAHINTDTGDLTLQVKKEDSGVFKGQFQVKGVLQYFERTITVIDAVSEPKVTCEQNDTDITLLCSVDPPVQAEFTWRGPDEFSHVGKSVHIIKK
ncbi:hypothetical protein PHYPO_G00205640 [Pangasianodon hypophthalmus]|uniref:Ig-like domain-containing protein n=1 Tax=Pangasianodon hypophthalmus TaxID=310915 RepID=A0A5N5PBK9_PANHP|nr:hypothetical protein PHYPO_G00205640 [Pangasianodon hypophthalmus]